jgi:hypothetical protein
MIPNNLSIVYTRYEHNRITGPVPGLLYCYPPLMVHLLGNFSLRLWPSRNVGTIFLCLYKVYMCLKNILTVAGSSFIYQYFLLLAWVYSKQQNCCNVCMNLIILAISLWEFLL